MPAAAARTTATPRKVIGSGDPPQFERLAHELHYRLLNLMHLLLSIQKLPRDRIIQQKISVPFKIGNLGPVQGRAGMLLLLQRIALFHYLLVLFLGGRITQKGFDARPDCAKLRLFNNDLAELLSLLNDDTFFAGSMHSVIELAFRQALSGRKQQIKLHLRSTV